MGGVPVARHDKEHQQATRQRILDTAGRRFKTDGIDGSGVATLTADAGLTNGAFSVDRARSFRREYAGPATSYVRDFDDQLRSALLLEDVHVPHRDLGTPGPARPDRAPG